MTAVREERRLVTSMFVDVVGSTELTMRLGAERLKHELGKAFAEISGIITTHGGTVEKYVGDAIYALFGAPVAHEDDPVRALRAAEAIREFCRTAPGQAFTVRVGIETGEAVVDLQAAATTKQQMSVGAVVNIAARLQQRAEPGEILVGPTACEAVAAVAELEPLGDVDLKGVGPLRVCRLVRTGAGQPERAAVRRARCGARAPRPRVPADAQRTFGARGRQRPARPGEDAPRPGVPRPQLRPLPRHRDALSPSGRGRRVQASARHPRGDDAR